MVHAKTAVADGKWARMGSSNLNIQSWLGNWELDVAVEDEAFAHEMEDMFLADLEHSTEIVLSERHITLVPGASQMEPSARRAWPRQRRTGRTRRAAEGGLGPRAGFAGGALRGGSAPPSGRRPAFHATPSLIYSGFPQLAGKCRRGARTRDGRPDPATGDDMREGIHPQYEEVTVHCGCGATWQTRSTKKDMHLDICSNCHPFFTGRQKLLDIEGRVDRFTKKYGAQTVEQRKVAAAAAKETKAKAAKKR